MRRWRRVLGHLLLVTVVLGGLVVPAQAEDDKEPWREPGIRYLKYQKPYIPWLIGSGIIIACLFVAFKNPHRSHMD